MSRAVLVTILLSICISFSSAQEHSVAREWNEVLLYAIRNHLARPTMHARNLFHHSMAMYDIWAVYDEEARPFLLGNTIGDFEVAFERFDFEGNVNEARDEAISHASYRLLLHRFQFSPECFRIQRQINEFFSDLGHDPRNASTDYQSGDPVALGNYVAQQIILFGLIDGGNEAANYDNQFYEPVNDGFFLENREWEIFPIQIDGNLWFSTSLLIKVEILFLLHFTRTRNLEV